LLALTGVALLGFYRAHPPDLESGQTLANVADQLYPEFIMSQMPPGLAGLVLAAILSAAMSSLSSGVNATCGVVDRDFLSRRPQGRLSGQAAVRRMWWLSWAIAGVAISLSMLNTLIEGNLIERCFKIVNLLTAPLFVLFFLALFVPWANSIGAWLGLVSSVITAMLIAYAKELGLTTDEIFIWMMPSSLVVGVGVGTIGSALTMRFTPRNAT